MFIYEFESNIKLPSSLFCFVGFLCGFFPHFDNILRTTALPTTALPSIAHSLVYSKTENAYTMYTA